MCEIRETGASQVPLKGSVVKGFCLGARYKKLKDWILEGALRRRRVWGGSGLNGWQALRRTLLGVSTWVSYVKDESLGSIPEAKTTLYVN